MGKKLRQFAAWLALGVVLLNGSIELGLLVAKSLAETHPPVEVAEPAAEPEDSDHNCPHCTDACFTGQGHVCMKKPAPVAGLGIAFNVPPCREGGSSQNDLFPASLAYLFLSPDSEVPFIASINREKSPAFFDIPASMTRGPIAPPPKTFPS